MEAIKTIEEVVEWYSGLSEDFLGINELIHKRTLLSTELFRFSVEIGISRNEWKSAEAKLETSRSQIFIKNKDKGASKAEWIAKANTEEEKYLEVQNESIFYAMDYILKASKEVLTDMNQKIAYLRGELKNSN